MRTLARRAYRTFPHLIEQIGLTSFIEGLTDSTLRGELRKSKPATADEALTMAMELNSFLELEKGARSTSTVVPESAVNLVSRTPSELQTNDLMDTFVRTRPTGHKTPAQVVLSQMAISLCVSRRAILGTRKIKTKNNIEDAHRN